MIGHDRSDEVILIVFNKRSWYRDPVGQVTGLHGFLHTSQYGCPDLRM